MSHGWRLNTARVRAGQGRQNSLDRNWHQRLQTWAYSATLWNRLRNCGIHVWDHAVFEDEVYSQIQIGNSADWQPYQPYSEEAPEELGFSCFYPSYSTGVLLIEWKNSISFWMSPKGLSPQLTWSPSRRSLPKIENRHNLFSTRERREEWTLVRSSPTTAQWGWRSTATHLMMLFFCRIITCTK